MRWEQVAEGDRGRRWRCDTCGLVSGWAAAAPLYHDCQRAEILATPVESPSFAVKLASFAGALVSHIAAGSPTAEPAEIERRLGVCLNCEHYDAAGERCNVCGCKCTRRGEWLNKLAWDDQHCPRGKW